MTSSYRAVWVSLFFAFSVGLGCESEESDGGPGDGSAGGDGAGDTCGSNIECVAAPSMGGSSGAACVNEADCSAVESGSARASAKECVLKSECSSGTAEEQTDCVATCVAAAEGTSAPCSECYAVSALCSKENCLGECVADADSCECFECQVDSGCREAFFQCAGIVDPLVE